MQNYTIFNKNNKVFIAKNLLKGEKVSEERIIRCNSEILNTYDFSPLFDDNQKNDWLVLAEGEDTEKVFEKVTSSLYFVKAAGGIIRNEMGDYLFMFRNGFWDMPKGHWEEGETIRQTAEREVLEECGMKHLEVKEYLASSFHSYYMHGRKEIKQTYWYDMFCPSSEQLTPQKEEGIKKIEWIKQQDLQKILQRSYPNIRYLFKTIELNGKQE